MGKFKTLLAAAGMVALSSPAFANILSIEDPASTSYQQTENSPCVIGNNSCKNGTFSYTLIPNQATYDLLSPVYSYQDLFDIVNSDSFIVGVDVNTAAGQTPETLVNFQFLKVDSNGNLIMVLDETNPMDPIGGRQFAVPANGNGFSDALISGFTSISDGMFYQFRASVIDATNGREQFFLISTETPPPVLPEPAVLMMLGAGLVGLGGIAARRRRKA